MNIFEMDGKTDFVVQLPLLNQDQLKRLTIRNVYAYWINKKRYAHAKKMYSTQFKFLRRFPLGPVVNDVPSVIRTLKNVQLFGRDGLKIGTISNVYPGYGLEPFKQNLAVLSAIQKGRIKHTTDRNTVEVIFSAHDLKELGLYNLLLLVEVWDPVCRQTAVWLIEIENKDLVELIEFNLDYALVYTSPTDDSRFVTTDVGYVYTDRE